MQITGLQIFLICLYLAYFTYETRSSETIFMYAGRPVFGGFVTGLILGNVNLGLQIGATLQLMSLGVGEFGGASIPDYHVGAIVGTMVCYMTNTNLDYALTIAIPVAMLMVQFDILARMTIAFFINKSREVATQLKIKEAYIWIVLGIVPYILRHIIPILIVYFIGGEAINSVLAWLPGWLMGAFNVAGKILPGMGVAILLRYMSTKKYFAYILIGFALVAYLKLPVLGLAIIATGLAIINYNHEAKLLASGTGGNSDDEI